jgi:hypothetical protein
MASTYTTRNRFTKQGISENENTWGDILNTVFDLLDESTDGVEVIDVSAGNVTLTTNNGASDQARNRVLKIIGEPGANRTITLPDVEKQYFVEVDVSGSFTVNIDNVAGSLGVTVSAGSQNQIIVCDAASTTSFLSDTDLTGLLVDTNNLSDVANTSAALANLGGTTAADMFDTIYPVGSIYFNASDSTNPGTLLGIGTWAVVGEGRVLVGVGTGTDINGVSAAFTSAQTGGEYEHTQTIAQLVNHSHSLKTENVQSGSGSLVSDTSPYSSGSESITTSVGGGDAFNVQQPYLAVYMWTRVS